MWRRRRENNDDPTSRLLPKKNFREPFGLLKFKVRSPSHIVRSPV